MVQSLVTCDWCHAISSISIYIYIHIYIYTYPLSLLIFSHSSLSSSVFFCLFFRPTQWLPLMCLMYGVCVVRNNHSWGSVSLIMLSLNQRLLLLPHPPPQPLLPLLPHLPHSHLLPLQYWQLILTVLDRNFDCILLLMMQVNYTHWSITSSHMFNCACTHSTVTHSSFMIPFSQHMHLVGRCPIYWQARLLTGAQISLSISLSNFFDGLVQLMIYYLMFLSLVDWFLSIFVFLFLLFSFSMFP